MVATQRGVEDGGEQPHLKRYDQQKHAEDAGKKRIGFVGMRLTLRAAVRAHAGWVPGSATKISSPRTITASCGNGRGGGAWRMVPLGAFNQPFWKAQSM